jgi:hypothetical protein
MVDFIASIKEINKLHGPFEAAIGHSLGGMSILNAIKQGLNVKCNSDRKWRYVQDIIEDFIVKLKLPPVTQSGCKNILRKNTTVK